MQTEIEVFSKIFFSWIFAFSPGFSGLFTKIARVWNSPKRTPIRENSEFLEL